MTSCEIPPPCRDVDTNGGAVAEGFSEPGAMGMGVLRFVDGLMAALPALVTSNNEQGGLKVYPRVRWR